MIVYILIINALFCYIYGYFRIAELNFLDLPIRP